jgi:hypothetical protein
MNMRCVPTTLGGDQMVGLTLKRRALPPGARHWRWPPAADDSRRPRWSNETLCLPWEAWAPEAAANAAAAAKNERRLSWSYMGAPDLVGDGRSVIL